jgi:anti-sigma-K factor RskA
MGPSIGRRVWVRRRLERAKHRDHLTSRPYNLRVAKVEPTVAAEEEAPPLDPQAVERAYRLHRARRAARERWHREQRWAGLRFWLVLVLVLAAAVLLAAWTLDEIERLFGL